MLIKIFLKKYFLLIIVFLFLFTACGNKKKNNPSITYQSTELSIHIYDIFTNTPLDNAIIKFDEFIIKSGDTINSIKDYKKPSEIIIQKEGYIQRYIKNLKQFSYNELHLSLIPRNAYDRFYDGLIKKKTGFKNPRPQISKLGIYVNENLNLKTIVFVEQYFYNLSNSQLGQFIEINILDSLLKMNENEIQLSFQEKENALYVENYYKSDIRNSFYLTLNPSVSDMEKLIIQSLLPDSYNASFNDLLISYLRPHNQIFSKENETGPLFGKVISNYQTKYYDVSKNITSPTNKLFISNKQKILIKKGENQ